MSRILVVQDDAAVRDVVEHAFSRKGMRTTAVGDGEAALKLVRGSERFDVVILDAMLPGIDGVSVCQELRADSFHRDVPVIMLSACNDETSVLSPARSALEAARVTRNGHGGASPSGSSTSRTRSGRPTTPLVGEDVRRLA